MRNWAVHIELYQLLLFGKDESLQTRKKNKNNWLNRKMTFLASTRKKHPKCVSPFPWYQQRGFLRFCWWNYSMVSTPPTLPPYRTTVKTPDPFWPWKATRPGNGIYPPCGKFPVGQRDSEVFEKPRKTRPSNHGWFLSQNVWGEEWMGSIPIYGISDHIRPVCKQKIP